jgi:uncharacterized membrane protein YccC
MTLRHRIRRLVRPLLDRVGLDPSFARDGLRFAVQTAVASVVVYLALRAVGLGAQAFVGILSAVYIIQPSIGGTMDAAKTRLVASVIGSAIGLACLFGLPDGWGTATAIFVTMFVLNGVAALKPNWMYGVVAAVALSLNAEGDLVTVALERCGAIALGAGLGLLTTLVVWPDSARERFERHMDAGLRAIRSAFRHVTDKAATDDPDRDIDGADGAREALGNAREALAALKISETRSRKGRVEAASDLFDGVKLLDRVTRRTGDLSGRGPLHDAVATFQREVDEVLERLARHDLPRPDARQRLADARNRVLATEDRVELSGLSGLDLAPVLAFAMTQIENALAELLDAEREAGRPTPSWADRTATRPRALAAERG